MTLWFSFVCHYLLYLQESPLVTFTCFKLIWSILTFARLHAKIIFFNRDTKDRNVAILIENIVFSVICYKLISTIVIH